MFNSTVFLLSFITFFSHASLGAEDIEVKVDSLTNLARSRALEACGTATSAGGEKPLLVTIRHDESYYTTLTAPNNKWCTVLKRWTGSGRIEVSATPLVQAGEFKFKTLDDSKLNVGNDERL